MGFMILQHIIYIYCLTNVFFSHGLVQPPKVPIMAPRQRWKLDATMGCSGPRPASPSNMGVPTNPSCKAKRQTPSARRPGGNFKDLLAGTLLRKSLLRRLEESNLRMGQLSADEGSDNAVRL